MERAMKVEEAMSQVMSKKINWWRAAEILGISGRNLWPAGEDDRRPSGCR